MTEAVQPLLVAPERWSINLFNHYVQCLWGNRMYCGPDGMAPEQGIYKSWHANRNNNAQVHVSVQQMLMSYQPLNFEKLALEYPQVSNTDEMRIAYTRNDADGMNGRQLVTSIGKYLARHWPHVPDHVRRDAQALYSIDERVIVTSREHIILTVEEGPRSCMASAHGSIPWKAADTAGLKTWISGAANKSEPDWEKHPYLAYAPKLGWSMAQRWSVSGGQGRRLDGRALLYSGPAHEDTNYKGLFVRTYARNKVDPVNGYSEADHALQSWLEKEGYKKVGGWPEGAQLRTQVLEGPGLNFGTIALPYVDGNALLELMPETENSLYRIAEFVNIHDKGTKGRYSPRNTDNKAAPMLRNVNDPDNYYDDEDDEDDPDNDYHSYCEDCDSRFHHDDMVWVGRAEDRHVCDGCCGDHYTEVRGARYHCQPLSTQYVGYYVSNDDSAEVYRPNHSNYCIDTDEPPSNVVQLEDGDWADSDDAVEIEGDYYLENHADYVALENGENAFRTHACEIDDKWYHQDDCYQSEEDEKWFLDEDERDEYDAAIVAAMPKEPETT
jgi:hypothetical protein